MNILWVKAGKLLPIDTGGKIRTFNILRQLCRSHEVTFLTYYGGEHDEEYERTVAKELPGSFPVHCPSMPVSRVQRGWEYVRRIADPAPFVVTNYATREVKQILEHWIPQRRFDVAVCDFLAASLNFPKDLPTPSVLFQHNVESILWERKAHNDTDPIRRAVWKLEYRKMRAYETAAVNRFHRVIAVSEQDREYMRRMTDPARIDVVPTGVDLQQFRRADPGESLQPLVVFVGSMDWRPNIDAVQYFCRDIWPSIVRSMPEARFRIVGRTPPKEIQQLASDTTEVTGTVPSILEHLQQAAVVVVPLRMGGGTRLKIYEAMAAGKAVVSTRVGAEGLEVVDGKDILLADSAPEFSEAVLRVLSDQVVRRSLEDAAVHKARGYDWSAITETFVAALQKAVNLSGSSETGHSSVAVLHA